MTVKVYSLKKSAQAVDPIPEGAVYVGRAFPRLGVAGSIWGNPYQVSYYGLPEALHRYELLARNTLANVNPGWLEPLRNATALVCWCRSPHTPYKPCHADVLIRLLEEMAA